MNCRRKKTTMITKAMMKRRAKAKSWQNAKKISKDEIIMLREEQIRHALEKLSEVMKMLKERHIQH